MVHGFTGAKEDFADFFDRLAERGWHVVAPDLRGHGASDHPSRPQDYSLDLFEADVLALVDDLGWDRFVLLGHSMGGMISQAIALHDPGRLDGLVLMDTVPDAPSVGGGAAMLRVQGGGAGVRHEGDGPPAAQAAARLARVGQAPLRRAARLRRVDPVQGARHLAGDGPGHDGRAGHPRRPRARAAVARPAGPRDRRRARHRPASSTGRSAWPTPSRAPRLAVLPGAAHNPQLETPDAWWAALTAFLDALPSAPSPAPETEGTT